MDKVQVLSSEKNEKGEISIELEVKQEESKESKEKPTFVVNIGPGSCGICN